MTIRTGDGKRDADQCSNGLGHRTILPRPTHKPAEPVPSQRGVFAGRFSMKSKEPVDEYAATVVMDERALVGSNSDEPAAETPKADHEQDVEAARRRNPAR